MFAIGALLLAAPAAAQSVDAALEAHARCLANEARRLDDGRSDAATVAAVIAPNCASQFYRVLDAWERAVSPGARAQFRAKAEAVHNKRALQAVLEVRAPRR